MTWMIIRNEEERHEKILTQRWIRLLCCSSLEIPGLSNPQQCGSDNSTMPPIIYGWWDLQ